MTEDFMPEGVLAKALSGFKPRASQRLMAAAIRDVSGAQQPLVVAAGTGTGKTYAYLVPALRADKKVFISNGSKAVTGSTLRPGTCRVSLRPCPTTDNWPC